MLCYSLIWVFFVDRFLSVFLEIEVFCILWFYYFLRFMSLFYLGGGWGKSFGNERLFYKC